MISTQKALQTLEYFKIIQAVAEHASTDGAKQMVLSLLPSDDFSVVISRQNFTDDAKRLIELKGYPSFYASEDCLDCVERVEKGGTLSPSELLHISSLLHSARMLQDYISTNKNIETSLDSLFFRLIPVRFLEDEIRHAILSEDQIADEASPELADIRRKIRLANNRVKDVLQNFVSGQRSKYLQENLVTMRNGRYVLPVKSEYRNEIKGFLHDTSSSGATVFIEPIGVVDANNEIRELEGKEAREIARILADLSEKCLEHSGAIRNNYHGITKIAFYYACASYALQLHAVRPQITDAGVVRLCQARHPLLDPKKVVPIDVSIGDTYDTLVITGPNTGGKTVALKTVGLFAVMVQAGLQIPVTESSEIGIFHQVLVDIGDDQSIEQSLSTFSSHMVNITNIIQQTTDRSLVILDELGAGTDPVEGAGLAIAILEHLRSKGALIATTTHYAELKMYALETEKVQNASCEFDLESLKPTYRLIIGMPGKSNAFIISEKLGLSSEIVLDAKARISSDNLRFEAVIEALEHTRAEMEKQKNEAEKLRAEYELYQKNAEDKLRNKTEEAEKEIQKYREKARQLIDSAKATSDFVFKELDAVKKKQEKQNFAQELSKAKDEIREHIRVTDALYDRSDFAGWDENEDYVLPRPLKLGETVFLVDYRSEGEVLALPDKKQMVSVRSGVLKAKVALSRIRLLEDVKIKKKKTPSVVTQSRRKVVFADFKPEIDVRGKIGEEAWNEIDKYIDDAVLAAMHSVRIIHGKGTGALRRIVQENLKHDPRVSSFRNGEFGEGDFGVTVVELK